MILSEKIRKGIEAHSLVTNALPIKDKTNWEQFTRTHFNLLAGIINRQITLEVLQNHEFVELGLIVGRGKLEKEIKRLRCYSLEDFFKYLANLGDFRIFNWISGKTLQSYWQQGEAQYIKVNALLCFLKVPYSDWDKWQKDAAQKTGYKRTLIKAGITETTQISAQQLIRRYYLGNYFLYYPKTDGSKSFIKAPFIIKESEGGSVFIDSTSEGHRYLGKVTGIRDGCLYIINQNQDFDEQEHYVFNIGLETNPEVLFGVSTTVSVKKRQPVALKNVLIKQKTNDPSFQNITSIEIPFLQKYHKQTEEAIIIHYLQKEENTIFMAENCCSLDDLKKMYKP